VQLNPSNSLSHLLKAKILLELNKFAEKHFIYHKDIGNGWAIFYYRSFWNVIFRRKCNQYVVRIENAPCGFVGFLAVCFAGAFDLYFCVNWPCA
jgi:hypothetical protein